eukprot:CAMPEP_0172486112 /NCGR_PEP_ID=MMETSP1066-20121228/14525_1 /TAXON_ID=671091 /ORGANISM="Coscinodiscus wailesii, Strain CCMP2513" /LENGTH=34 /DNA_ID= /DNA_START= /DNA_END= /DNA_ORIENTATION=
MTLNVTTDDSKAVANENVQLLPRADNNNTLHAKS